jgi:hypothetical protein
MSPRWSGLAFLFFFSAAGWPPDASSAVPDKGVAARVKRDTARCVKHRNVEACNDAIRWNPSDAALLVALADALVRAQRPADALRHYRRAAALAPNMAGLSAKISAAEKRLAAAPSPSRPRRAIPAAPPRAPARTPIGRAAPNGEPDKHYSNADPETQSH